MCTNSSHVCFYCSPCATLCLTARCPHQPFVLFPTLLNASIAVHTHRGLIRTMPQIALESHHKGMSPRSRRGWLCVHLCVCICVCVCERQAKALACHSMQLLPVGSAVLVSSHPYWFPLLGWLCIVPCPLEVFTSWHTNAMHEHLFTFTNAQIYTKQFKKDFVSYHFLLTGNCKERTCPSDKHPTGPNR